MTSHTAGMPVEHVTPDTLARVVQVLDDAAHHVETCADAVPLDTLTLHDVHHVARSVATVVDGLGTLLARRAVNDAYAAQDPGVVYAATGTDATEDLRYGVIADMETSAGRADRLAHRLADAAHETIQFDEAPHPDGPDPAITARVANLRAALVQVEALTHYVNYQATALGGCLPLDQVARLVHTIGATYRVLGDLLGGHVWSSVERLARVVVRIHPNPVNEGPTFEAGVATVLDAAGAALVETAADLLHAAQEMSGMGVMPVLTTD